LLQVPQQLLANCFARQKTFGDDFARLDDDRGLGI
jgi:hypothetical protein